MSKMNEFEKKHPYFWLVLGLLLTMLSYGIFNTGVCAWIFAIPLIRFINNRTKWSSIILMLIGMIIVANITFFRLVEDDFNIMNQVFCTFNGIRIWFPFFVYFLCRYIGAKKIIGYYAFPAAVAAAEFFVDNPFISVMTSLSVSQFWNLGLMQVASVTGVVGVSFIVTLFAPIVNYIWEEGIRKATVMNAVGYGIAVVAITGIGMFTVERITTTDQTVRIAAGVENFNLLLEDKSILARYAGSDEEKMLQANMDIIKERAKQAVQNESALLVFPEDAFTCSELSTEKFIEGVKGIAKENKIHILLPLLRLPTEEGRKQKNTLNFINRDGELLNTYLKNHLVPVVEEPETEKGDGKTPVIEVDGVKYTYLICADYTSNKYAYNGREADIFLNPSYDWKAFQYFTSYGVQARAIECGFSVLRNPVNGNIILYDVYGRPLHMANVMNVQTGMIYFDIPKQGRQTVYGATGNWFPWICAIYSLFAMLSGFII
ncbi:MAG: carbon-nitrogen hydrolase family protein [Synergistaceae bacterium]|nr:carbon-nitrogen hydrolase family protein [Synergistaceae bacterium]